MRFLVIQRSWAANRRRGISLKNFQTGKVQWELATFLEFRTEALEITSLLEVKDMLEGLHYWCNYIMNYICPHYGRWQPASPLVRSERIGSRSTVVKSELNATLGQMHDCELLLQLAVDLTSGPRVNHAIPRVLSNSAVLRIESCHHCIISRSNQGSLDCLKCLVAASTIYMHIQIPVNPKWKW